jgi:hypothetical protein
MNTRLLSVHPDPEHAAKTAALTPGARVTWVGTGSPIPGRPWGVVTDRKAKP